MVDLSVNLCGVTLQNPVIPASGTFGFGAEMSDIYDLNILGSISTKGTTFEPRFGNSTPRIADCTAGLLNSVGLQNPGAKEVAEVEIPNLRKHFHQPIMGNVCGFSLEDYRACCEIIAPTVELVELNISCPNVHNGGMAFGTTPEGAASVVKAVREVYHKHLMVKLSPNVTNIADIALAAEAAGADSVSLINTLLGMAIDAETRKPVLSMVTGGLSGACVKPVALRMVWQVSKAVKIPVIGLGGISSATDAIEFLLAGASAIQIGTANFIDPAISAKVAKGIVEYCERHGVEDVNDLVGGLIV